MSNADSYYPRTIDGRAHWWQVVLDHASAVLTLMGYPSAQIAPITTDAEWAIYCYGSVHRFFGTVSKALTDYERVILDSPDGGVLPPLPVIPTMPDPPASPIAAGIEARRIRWVQEIKKNVKYTPAIGAQLGIDTPATPFNPGAYACDLFDVASRAPQTVAGKFRKAGGHVDGINFYGRKSGTAAWQALGRFNATPFSASVPLGGSAPEEWEFYAMAVKKDVEFGTGSPIAAVIVRA